jgi:long-chain fatty acid transport protein
VAAVLTAQPAHASGFLAARFGGEHGHPTTSNPTAIYYNPAGLALPSVEKQREPGWNFRLYLDGTLAYRTADYTRPAAAIENVIPEGSSGTGTPASAISANSGKAELSNFIVSPFIAVTSDFGLDNFGAGIGVYVPMGGSASWDDNDAFEGDTTFPGAVDGVQRWWTMDGRLQSLYLTGAAAYYIPSLRLSIGAGISAIQSKVHTVRARNADGSDDLVTPSGALAEGRSLIDVESWNLGLSGGVIWEPVRNVWLGVSYQSQPGLGEMELEGDLETVFGGGGSETTPVVLQQELPDVWRFGARYRPAQRWELRAFAEYARWSVIERQCIIQTVDADGNEISNPVCDIRADGSEVSGGEVTQNIPRNWKDAFGVRVGASYWLTPAVELYAGGGYDSNAVPDETIDSALMDMPKWTAAVGGQFDLTERWLLAATFTQVFYNERDVAVEDVKRFAAPSRQPNSAGVYNQSISVLNVYTQYAF